MGKGASQFAEGYPVYAPICMGHPISVVGEHAGLGYDAVAWDRHNLVMLETATHLVILNLDGLSTSKGVAAELAFARKKGLPVWLLDETLDSYHLSDYHADRHYIADAEADNEPA